MRSLTENSPELWKSFLRKPSEEDHKYKKGSVIINGSVLDSAGATKLASHAAYAALRSGAGIVTVACSEESLPIYAASHMSVMNKVVKTDKEFAELVRSKRANALLLGPANGVTDATKQRVLVALSLNIPTVLDADALTVFAKNRDELFSAIHENCILTPHEGEFNRLFPELEGDKVEKAARAAEISGAVIVFKGNDTVIASPSGKVVINKNAPSNLAVAGTGDVLAGIISAILAGGTTAFESACVGVWVHSKAAEKFSTGMIAEDLLGEIPSVISDIF